MSIDAAVDRHRTFTEDLYRELHEHPELSHRENRTAARMATLLRETGLEVHESVGNSTGVVGILRNGRGPTVLLRADMDGLPVTEVDLVPYRSTQTDEWEGQTVGVMHACGHDTHMASLQSAVRILAEQRETWSGTIVSVFQPAEETVDGAAGMTDALRALVPSIDVALGQHVIDEAAGRVLLSAGPIMATSNMLKITVHGRGGHGSQPEKTVDPIVLASSIILRLQTIVSREIAPSEPAVLTVGTFHAGTKGNIIPASATFEVNIRAFDEEFAERIIAAVERIVAGECRAAGTPEPATVERSGQAPLTSNDAQASARLQVAFETVFGDAVRPLPAIMGSEDFSDLPNAYGAPYVFWMYGGFDAETYRAAQEAGTIAEVIPGNHSPSFVPVIQPTLDVATRAMVTAALAYVGR
ncbi:MAG: amidohydrolase [Micrococcales bacterium]|nr:amidohydrolase [Micrococcales bacterium]